MDTSSKKKHSHTYKQITHICLNPTCDQKILIQCPICFPFETSLYKPNLNNNTQINVQNLDSQHEFHENFLVPVNQLDNFFKQMKPPLSPLHHPHHPTNQNNNNNTHNTGEVEDQSSTAETNKDNSFSSTFLDQIEQDQYENLVKNLHLNTKGNQLSQLENLLLNRLGIENYQCQKIKGHQYKNCHKLIITNAKKIQSLIHILHQLKASSDDSYNKDEQIQEKEITEATDKIKKILQEQIKCCQNFDSNNINFNSPEIKIEYQTEDLSTMQANHISYSLGQQKLKGIQSQDLKINKESILDLNFNIKRKGSDENTSHLQIKNQQKKVKLNNGDESQIEKKTPQLEKKRGPKKNSKKQNKNQNQEHLQNIQSKNQKEEGSQDPLEKQEELSAQIENQSQIKANKPQKQTKKRQPRGPNKQKNKQKKQSNSSETQEQTPQQNQLQINSNTQFPNIFLQNLPNNTNSNININNNNFSFSNNNNNFLIQQQKNEENELQVNSLAHYQYDEAQEQNHMSQLNLHHSENGDMDLFNDGVENYQQSFIDNNYSFNNINNNQTNLNLNNQSIDENYNYIFESPSQNIKIQQQYNENVYPTQYMEQNKMNQGFNHNFTQKFEKCNDKFFQINDQNYLAHFNDPLENVNNKSKEEIDIKQEQEPFSITENPQNFYQNQEQNQNNFLNHQISSNNWHYSVVKFEDYSQYEQYNQDHNNDNILKDLNQDNNETNLGFDKQLYTNEKFDKFTEIQKINQPDKSPQNNSQSIFPSFNKQKNKKQNPKNQQKKQNKKEIQIYIKKEQNENDPQIIQAHETAVQEPSQPPNPKNKKKKGKKNKQQPEKEQQQLQQQQQIQPQQNIQQQQFIQQHQEQQIQQQQNLQELEQNLEVEEEEIEVYNFMNENNNSTLFLNQEATKIEEKEDLNDDRQIRELQQQFEQEEDENQEININDNNNNQFLSNNNSLNNENINFEEAESPQQKIQQEAKKSNSNSNNNNQKSSSSSLLNQGQQQKTWTFEIVQEAKDQVESALQRLPKKRQVKRVQNILINEHEKIVYKYMFEYLKNCTQKIPDLIQCVLQYLQAAVEKDYKKEDFCQLISVIVHQYYIQNVNNPKVNAQTFAALRNYIKRVVLSKLVIPKKSNQDIKAKRWTKEEIDSLMTLLKDQVTYFEIARILNRPYSGIVQQINKQRKQSKEQN